MLHRDWVGNTLTIATHSSIKAMPGWALVVMLVLFLLLIRWWHTREAKPYRYVPASTAPFGYWDRLLIEVLGMAGAMTFLFIPPTFNATFGSGHRALHGTLQAITYGSILWILMGWLMRAGGVMRSAWAAAPGVEHRGALVRQASVSVLYGVQLVMLGTLTRVDTLGTIWIFVLALFLLAMLLYHAALALAHAVHAAWGRIRAPQHVLWGLWTVWMGSAAVVAAVIFTMEIIVPLLQLYPGSSGGSSSFFYAIGSLAAILAAAVAAYFFAGQQIAMHTSLQRRRRQQQRKRRNAPPRER